MHAAETAGRQPLGVAAILAANSSDGKFQEPNRPPMPTLAHIQLSKNAINSTTCADSSGSGQLRGTEPLESARRTTSA